MKVQAFPAGFHALVVGATGGIGRALVEALLDRSDCGRVFATCRPGREAPLQPLAAGHADRLVILPLDLTDAESICAAAARTPRLHLLINTAGVLHDGASLQPERRLEQVQAESLRRSFEVNAIGPVLLARHFTACMSHGEAAVFASLSARVGSIADNRLGGWYAYRAAKAAQNQLLRTLAIEMARRAPKLRVLALHPGTVDTALSHPFQSGVAPEKLFSPARAAAQLLRVIETSEGSGRFLAWDGSEIPW